MRDDFFLPEISLNFLVHYNRKDSASQDAVLQTISERNNFVKKSLKDYIFYLSWKEGLCEISNMNTRSTLIAVEKMAKKTK